MARPTKYTSELLEAANEYLENYREHGDQMPSHIGLFLAIGISRTCGYDWAKEEGKEVFSDILDKCLMLQHQKLMNSGLTGDFNAAITKLALGKHGYSDKTENEHSGPNGKPMEFSQVCFNPVGVDD